MTGSRESFRQKDAAPRGDSRGSSSGWGSPDEESLGGLPSRVVDLRRREEEEPNGRWFLPLASALHDLDLAPEAAQVLRRGLAKDPDCLGGWVLMARCYLAMGEVEIAKGLLESSAARDPENALALRGLAQVHALEGDRRRAAEEYRALLRVMPRDLKAHEALASLLADGDAEAPHLNQTARPVARRPSRRQAPRSVHPPRGSRAVLPAERRTRPGLFEAPPADLDEDAEDPANRRGERRTRTTNRSPRAGTIGDGQVPGVDISGSELPSPSVRSLKDYERWMQRMARNQATRDDHPEGSGPAPAGPIAPGGE